MKTNTIQNKLKKMQLFFKKSLLFEKIIISLHLMFFDILLLKSSTLSGYIQKINAPIGRANLLVCIGSGRPQRRVISPRF